MCLKTGAGNQSYLYMHFQLKDLRKHYVHITMKIIKFVPTPGFNNYGPMRLSQH